MEKIEALLKIQEAADIANCSIRTIKRAIATEKLKAYKPCGVRIYPQDLQNWIKAKQVTPSKKKKQGRHRKTVEIKMPKSQQKATYV